MKLIKTLKDGTRIYHWTREEQIENAYEGGTEEEMQPPLKARERR